jgi:hypothetical protein
MDISVALSIFRRIHDEVQGQELLCLPMTSTRTGLRAFSALSGAVPS